MQRERIQKILARAGIASRRKSEELILNGFVRVNGILVTELGSTVDPVTDQITVDHRAISICPKKVYYLFYKPRYVISSCSDEKQRRTVLDFFPTDSIRLYPVGRLDYESDGLLIVTNDGDFTFALTHPKHDIAKTYLVHVKEDMSEVEINHLRAGVTIDDYRTKSCQIVVLKNKQPGTWLEITLFEGRNRQIRKMLALFQKRVLSLTRTRIGPCVIGSLEPGTYRSLTKEEINFFLRCVQVKERDRK